MQLIDDETVLMDESTSSEEAQSAVATPGGDGGTVEENLESQLESGSDTEVEENPQPKKVRAKKSFSIFLCLLNAVLQIPGPIAQRL